MLKENGQKLRFYFATSHADDAFGGIRALIRWDQFEPKSKKKKIHVLQKKKD